MGTESIAPRPESTPIGGPRPVQAPNPVDPVSRDRKRDSDEERRRRKREQDPPLEPDEDEESEDGKGGHVNIRV